VQRTRVSGDPHIQGREVRTNGTYRWPAARAGWLLTIAAAALLSALGARTLTAQTGTSAAAPQEATVGDGTPAEQDAFVLAAEATIEKTCTECHPWDNIVQKRKTVSEWNETVATMAARGAQATEPQLETIKRYLKRYYGVVPVNSAPAADLSAVLGLSPAAAEAVVEYRKAHGKFADLEALSKVDGVDKSKLEEQPEALRFD
jgi:competence ComEA-like helix-hairpin-helix protein